MPAAEVANLMHDPRPTFDARAAIHAALAAIMGWLGFILILPGDSFVTSSSFNVMSQIADENTWAISFGIAASAGAVGMATSNRKLRLASVLVLSTAHGIFALCLLTANPLSTGLGTYGIIAGLGYYLAYRRTLEGVATAT